FEDTRYDGNWNGTDQNGNELSEGTYFYIFNRSDGESFSGTVTIIRKQ
ncbi:MAG: gliding motility-associated C-terminal domain-containing protein, partial [Flavobacteriales bacterium]|nr:gliding motility-associated C-terminal domain-containing protein [Flavobacteriales bacterium]